MSTPSANPLAVLVGEQLSSVEFVMDYVQLRFDGYCLTAFTGPSVHLAGGTVRWGEAGYRDALCERIATLVREASVRDGDAICIVFEDGAAIEVSLQEHDERVPEAAMFTDLDDALWVWQINPLA